MNAGEGVEKKEPSYTIGDNINWYIHCGEQHGGSLKNQTELSDDPAIPLLGIYPEKTIIEKDTCTPVLIAALFTIARTWEQPRYPLMNEWIKKMWCIDTMEYYSAIEKNEIESFETMWMNLEPVIQSKVR